MLKAVSLSRQGEKSDSNEDACLVNPSLGLFVVADGVGGNPAGELASRTLVDTLHDELGKQDMNQGSIAEAVVISNSRVYANNTGLPKGKGMASTLVLAWIEEERLICCWAGDSRIYRFRNGQMQQLTQDHVKEVVSARGTKNLVTKVIGAGETVEPEFCEFDWLPNDTLLLCSDGISDQLTADEISNVVTHQGLAMSDKAKILIDQSVKKGGRDDKTVVLVF